MYDFLYMTTVQRLFMLVCFADSVIKVENGSFSWGGDAAVLKK